MSRELVTAKTIKAIQAAAYRQGAKDTVMELGETDYCPLDAANKSQFPNFVCKCQGVDKWSPNACRDCLLEAAERGEWPKKTT